MLSPITYKTMIELSFLCTAVEGDSKMSLIHCKNVLELTLLLWASFTPFLVHHPQKFFH